MPLSFSVYRSRDLRSVVLRESDTTMGLVSVQALLRSCWIRAGLSRVN